MVGYTTIDPASHPPDDSHFTYRDSFIMNTVTKIIGGSLLAVLLVAALPVGIGYWSFGRMVAREVRNLFAKPLSAGSVIVPEAGYVF